MILNLNGDINRYYVQTLCMIFFPGATFGKDEVPSETVPQVNVDVYKDVGGSDTAYVSIKLNNKLYEATATVSYDEDVIIANPASIAVGRALLACGKEIFNQTPPWGILTGIRPAKIANTLIHKGNGILKSKRILRDKYHLNPQKAALAVSVATSENKILKKLPKNNCSIYISIPFCPSRCSYCSFVSYTSAKLLSLINEYVDVLISEFNDTVEIIRKLNLEVSTVYIGGGTPTTLNCEQLEKLLLAISSSIDTEKLAEFTLEAGRPDTITEEKMALAYKYGVTRVSVNPQTLNDDILKSIGRRHTTEDFYKAYNIAQNSGIRDINVDLIAGLPGDDFKNFSDSMDKVIELMPSNITVHSFCVKKSADVLRSNSDIYSLSSNDAVKSVSYSQLKTKLAGYKPYYMYRQKNTIGNLENVGFSLDGHESLYNVFMMEEVQTIFAVGAGAVTKLVDRNADFYAESRIERIFNPKYPYEYLRNYSEDKERVRRMREEKIFEFFSYKENQ